MAKLMRKMLLLAKIESPSGTDAVPTSTANAMLVQGLTPELVTAEFVPRDLIRPYMGNSSSLAASIHRQVSFGVEIAGAGTAGGTPAWDPLIRACGFAASSPSGSPGEKHYKPISDSIPTITIYEYLDGILWKMTGCVGTVALNFTSKGIPRFQFRFIGEYSAGTDTALPGTIDYSSFRAPVTVGKVHTPTFSLHGVSACLQSLNIDMANNIVYRDLVGCGGPALTDRKPVGTAVFELPSIATYAWDEAIANGTEGTLRFRHGRTAGNIVDVECPVVVPNSPSLQDQDGVCMLSVGLSLNPSAGNDEVEIICS